MLCLALSFIKPSNSQVDPTTGNLINFTGTPTATTSNWNNGVYVNSLTCWHPGEAGNCGPYPNVNRNGTINFSYGQVDLNQVININAALAAGGTGVQLTGFNFAFRAKNGNGWDNGQQDYLAAYVSLYNANGTQAANYDYSSQTNRKYNWTDFNFHETFANPYIASTLSTARVGFIGRDTNGWAGPYGPEITNVSFNLAYRVDPCTLNPAYSSICAGFNKVINTNNLLPSNDFAGSYNQAIAINTALTNAGVGAMVHGFNYGFSYKVGQSWSGCTATNQDGSCSWYMDIPASARVTASLTSNTNQSLYQRGYSYTGDNTNGNVSEKFILPSSLNQTALGTFRLNGSSMGTGSTVGNFWSSIIYTADPCANNPLYSTDCKGYAAAFAAKLNASNTVVVQANTSTPTIESSTSSTPSVNVGGVQMSTTGSISAPDNIPQALKDVQAVTQQSQVASTQSKSTPNMSLIMSVLNQVQANDKATQTAAVQNANQVTATSAAKAQEQANQVVEALNAMSQSSSQASMLQATNNAKLSMPTTQTNISVVQLQQPTAATQMSYMAPIQPITLVQSQQTVSLTTPQVQLPTQQPQPVSSFGSTNVIASMLPPQVPITKYESQQKVDTSLVAVVTQYEQPKFENKQQEVDMPTVSFNTNMSRGSNVNDLFASKINFESLQSEQSIDTVNKNVSANELAGNVDIASIATTPKGFEAYSFMLKDAAFYKVEAIYKDQKTVDNARAFRSLSNDRLHQEMVDQQYKGK